MTLTRPEQAFCWFTYGFSGGTTLALLGVLWPRAEPWVWARMEGRA